MLATRLRTHITLLTGFALLLTATAWSQTTGARDDLVLADFEGADYAGWTAEGTAFGDRPARGTWPNQMAVSGFEGQGLVNSYNGSDRATGRLTSQPFLLDRRFLNFLIGGGKFPGQTCINLLVDGQVVRTATGPNDRPGGSEALEAASWDVTPWQGRQAILEIVDEATGGWGHVNVDHIVLSDTDRGLQPASRAVEVSARYLHLPVDNQSATRRMKLAVDDQTIREFDIKLATSTDESDFLVFTELADFQGQKLTIDSKLPGGARALQGLQFADQVPGANQMYAERDRPQVHFTARRGWLNDPNGLVYHQGLWHLFFQHNPYGWDWGNMHWGHATSPDLVHWTEHAEALTPRQYDDWCFSGSAVVDTGNTSGFSNNGKDDPLVLAYTSTGRGECIAYSNDNGATWTEYEGNPVVKHKGRDPRLLWYAPARRWVMAVYDEEAGQAIAFYSSPDLKNWSFTSRIDGFYECPDLFPLPVRNQPGEEPSWILYGADGKYLTGRFDGQSFTPDSADKATLWHGNFYAAQTYSNTPNDRRIQVGWGRGITFPGMPFNQQMTVPCELTAWRTPEGIRLRALPVNEMASLRRATHRQAATDLDGTLDLSVGNVSPPLEILTSFAPGNSKSLTITAAGVDVRYEAETHQITCGEIRADLPPAENGQVSLQILIDRGSVEVFGNQGRVALSSSARPSSGGPATISVKTTGGPARLQELVVHELKSAWPSQ